jgi:hypothetical protein
MKINPKQCPKCKVVYDPTGPAQKFCKACGKTAALERMRARHRATYVRKGYNQTGAANNNWQGGIGIYRELKKADFCDLCGGKEYLLIHHKDGNRRNNAIDNLQCLCKKCHQIEHECWKSLPKGKKLSKLKKAQAADAKRDRDGKFTT